MSLTKSQFDLLRPLAEGETDSAPATAEAAELTARGLLCAGRLTDAVRQAHHRQPAGRGVRGGH